MTLSITDVEYMAIIEAREEAIWLRKMFGEITEDLQMYTVFCNNQSAIFPTKDYMLYERTSHIDVVHFGYHVITRSDIVISNLTPRRILLIR